MTKMYTHLKECYWSQCLASLNSSPYEANMNTKSTFLRIMGRYYLSLTHVSTDHC